MKRTAQTLFELVDIIGECLTGDLHIIRTNDDEYFTTYIVYTKEGVSFTIERYYSQSEKNEDFYDFQPIWQGNNKLTVYTANQLLEQFQK